MTMTEPVRRRRTKTARELADELGVSERFIRSRIAESREDFEALLGMIDRGELDPVVTDVLPLSQAVEGLRKVRDREVLGKIVVTPGVEQ